MSSPRAHSVSDDDDSTREAKENEMVEEFCNAIVKHKQGEKKDMDVAVFGAFDSNLVGFLVVRCVVPLHVKRIWILL